MKRRHTFKIFGAAMALAAMLASPVIAQDWTPKRPINLIVPSSAGGGVDTYGRAVGSALQEKLGVPVVIVNKPGAGGLVGSAEVASARPDGHTMLIAASGAVLLGSMFKDAPIDIFDSFETVAQIGDLVFCIAVPADSPIMTATDLVEAAMADPGGLRWAHGSRGSATHVPVQSLLNLNGISATDVPFQGGAKIRAAIIGEQVDFGVMGIQQSFGFENELRVIGVFSDARYPLRPDTPTFDEQGIETGNIGSPVTLYYPKGTPSDAVKTISAAMSEITAMPEFSEALASSGLTPKYRAGDAADAALLQIKEKAQPVIDELKQAAN